MTIALQTTCPSTVRIVQRWRLNLEGRKLGSELGRSLKAGLWLAGVACSTLIPARAAETTAGGQAHREVRFTNSAPYSSKAEMKRRFGFSEPAIDYRIAAEEFSMIVPETYSSNSGWGLLVWISPGSSLRLPEDWEPVLARHRLLVVGANNAGNARSTIDRLRLALDATFNVCRRYQIDRKRIFIGGMSGGARMASELGVACADIFTGTLCVCGVNYFKDIPVTRDSYTPASYRLDPKMLPLAARKGRYVLLTGEFDFNRDNTKNVLTKGFQADGFKSVLYLEVAGMKHAMPGAAVLSTALDYLDGIERRGSTIRNPP